MQSSILRKIKPSLSQISNILQLCTQPKSYNCVCLHVCVHAYLQMFNDLQLVSTAHVISARLRFYMCIYTHTHVTRLTTHLVTDSLIIYCSPRLTSSPSSCPNSTIKHNHNSQNDKLQLYNTIRNNFNCINFHINWWFMRFVVVCSHNNVQLNQWS